MAVRIAMWSGPRNISTAMMRSFGARLDTVVTDEPLYAAYLAGTDLYHPGREQILTSQPTDWAEVAAMLSGPIPGGAEVWYQKHMTHHLLPVFGQDWLGELQHAFLIRNPAHVIASYARVREEPTLEDLGFTQQLELFREFGGPVVDAADLLANPPAMLLELCEALGIPYDDAMLSWPAGARATDGVWAKYWYASVEASTRFAPYDPSPAVVPGHLQHLVDAAQPAYDELAAQRLIL